MKRVCLMLTALLCSSAIFAANKQSTVVVKNASEFIEALGPDRTIVIDSRAPLMLTPVINEGVSTNKLYEFDYYNFPGNPTGLGWYDNFDGNGLSITGYHNLTIKSKDGNRATLLVSPRYADVLLFERCDNLTLDNVVLGHTDTGSCMAGVLELRSCNNVKVNNCDLFGCGTEAIIISKCMYVDITNTEMHHCSYYSLHVSNSSHVRFKDCNIHDNKEFEQINISDSYDVWFDACNFINLKGKLFNLNTPIDLYDCVIEGCDFKDYGFINIHGPRNTGGEVWNHWIEMTGSDVNLRDEPSTEGAKQSIKLAKGEYAPKLDETDDWVKIYQPNSPLGYAWVYKQFAKDVNVDAVPEMVRDCMSRVQPETEAFVDLGLSVDWASANFMAVSKKEFGEFMTWPQATAMQYADGWRLPTAQECSELLSLPHQMVQLPSEERLVVFTAPNGNTVSFPMNGYTDEDGNQDFGFFGYYWTSSRTADGLYPQGMILKAFYDDSYVGKLIDDLKIGVRLVHEKDGMGENSVYNILHSYGDIPKNKKLHDEYTDAKYNFDNGIEYPGLAGGRYQLEINWSQDMNKATSVRLLDKATKQFLIDASDVAATFDATGALELRIPCVGADMVISFSNDNVNIYNVVEGQAPVLTRIVDTESNKCELPARSSIKDYFKAVAPYVYPGNGVVQSAVEAIDGKIEASDMLIDEKNGFMAFDFGYEEDGKHVETCYWRMKNGKVLVAVSYYYPLDEEYLRFFVVDPTSKTVHAIPMPFNTPFYRFSASLPRQGKTIKAKAYHNGDPMEFDATFDGEKFVLKGLDLDYKDSSAVETNRPSANEAQNIIDMKNDIQGLWVCRDDDEITLLIEPWSDNGLNKGYMLLNTMIRDDQHDIIDFVDWDVEGSEVEWSVVIKTDCSREPYTDLRYSLRPRLDENTEEPILICQLIGIERNDDFFDCCLIPLQKDAVMIFERRY